MAKPVLMYCLKPDSGVSSSTRAVTIANRLCHRFGVVIVADTRLPTSLTVDPRIDFVELPPLGGQSRSSATSEGGTKPALLQSDIARRGALYLERYSRIKPDVVLIEEYPIGENHLYGSLMPMLERISFGSPASPLVIGSVSNFYSDPWMDDRAHDDRAADVMADYFDALLIHSDSGFARLGEFFQPKNTPSTPIYHTGFIAAEASQDGVPVKRRRRIVVSLDGNINDGRMCQAAVDAHKLLWEVEQVSMTLVAGQSISDTAWHSLCVAAETLDGLEVRRTLDSPAAELSASSWAVCHADHDTALDVVAAGIPALLVPVGDQRQGEQIDRARRLAHWGVGQVLLPNHLNGVSLANSLHQMIREEREVPRFNLDGAEVSANILYHLSIDEKSGPINEDLLGIFSRPRPH